MCVKTFSVHAFFQYHEIIKLNDVTVGYVKLIKPHVPSWYCLNIVHIDYTIDLKLLTIMSVPVAKDCSMLAMVTRAVAMYNAKCCAINCIIIFIEKTDIFYSIPVQN